MSLTHVDLFENDPVFTPRLDRDVKRFLAENLTPTFCFLTQPDAFLLKKDTGFRLSGMTMNGVTVRFIYVDGFPESMLLAINDKNEYYATIINEIATDIIKLKPSSSQWTVEQLQQIFPNEHIQAPEP